MFSHGVTEEQRDRSVDVVGIGLKTIAVAPCFTEGIFGSGYLLRGVYFDVLGLGFGNPGFGNLQRLHNLLNALLVIGLLVNLIHHHGAVG